MGKLNEGRLAVGWSTKDITPEKPVSLHGQFYERISEYVHDPLTVTALALEVKNEGEVIDQAIIISCDLVSVEKTILNKLRKIIASIIPELDVGKIFINATHTHTGPYTTEDPDKSGVRGRLNGLLPNPVATKISENMNIMTTTECQELLLKQLKKAVLEAWSNRRPGGISWVLGHAVVGHNRRLVYDNGARAQMYGSSDTINFDTIEGPSDHGIEMLFVWDEEEELIGIVLNVACPSQVVEGENYISADYWSEVRKELRKRYGEDLFILPQCSAAGDQSPRDLVRRGRGEADMRGEAGLVAIGKKIANAVDVKIEEARNKIKTTLPFCHRVEEIDLTKRQVSRDEYDKAKKEFDEITADLDPDQELKTEFIHQLFIPAGIIKRYEEQQEDPFFTMELHGIRLGEIAFVTNPFELFIDYGLRMKARSKAEQTFLVQLSCDAGYYLPTQKAVKGGSYSAIVPSNNVGPEGGEILVDQTVKMLNKMWE